MASLKGSEQFVAHTLKTHFLKTNQVVSYEEGGDPPDIFLIVGDERISVEITDIDQNVLKDGKTTVIGYLRFLDNLDRDFGNLVNDQKKLIIFFYHNYFKVSVISKKFKNLLRSFFEKNGHKTLGSIEGYIENVGYKISTVEMPKNSKRKISGGVTAYGGKVKKARDIKAVFEQISDVNLMEQTLSIIQNRIIDKNEKCKGVDKPVWLALYDNYYNKFTDFKSTEHIEHYNNVFDQIYDFFVFEKIIVVFENGDICEFTHNSAHKPTVKRDEVFAK